MAKFVFKMQNILAVKEKLESQATAVAYSSVYPVCIQPLIWLEP